METSWVPSERVEVGLSENVFVGPVAATGAEISPSEKWVKIGPLYRCSAETVYASGVKLYVVIALGWDNKHTKFEPDLTIPSWVFTKMVENFGNYVSLKIHNLKSYQYFAISLLSDLEMTPRYTEKNWHA